MYNIKTNLLEYGSLIRAVKCYIGQLDNIKIPNNPVFPFKLKVLRKSSKGCNDIYKLLNYKSITPKAHIKYANEGFIIDDEKWKKYNSIPFKCLNITLAWFQYRLIHRIIATNTFLYKIHYVKANICTFCSTEPETLSHLFYDCHIVKNLWEEVQTWIIVETGIIIQLEKHTVIFGMINNEKCRFVNWLTINIKHYIYRMKVQKQKLNIKAIKNILQKQFQIEKYIKNIVNITYSSSTGHHGKLFSNNY